MSATPGPSSTEQQAIQAVMQALNTLYTDPNNQAKASANTWLQKFQQTPEAWQTANSLLLATDLPLEPRLFAAQTFRTKITFDLEQVPSQQRVALRDTLLTAISAYASGPRVIQTQLSLALSGLALQLNESEWPTVVPGMIERYGSSPDTVPVLLEFLTVLPEEVITNHRIPVDNDFYNTRCHFLLSAAAPEILKLLSMYVQASGLTSQIQTGIFQCLRSWLKSGEVSASQMADTQLFDLSFDALASDELFDVATDVVCDLINETQEVEENMDVIQRVIHRLHPLRQELTAAAASDDEDKVRGLCRIFVQAGEAYHRIILRHRNELLPIVEAIAECTAYHDLDIVQITFRFWYLLSGALYHARDAAEAQAFYPLYERLLEVIIRHLRFPDDPDALTGQERDDFRSFRHFMGDTLKDCCHVLGSRQCLSRSLHLIQTTIAQSTPETLKWQDVEAPLFSMRAMGAEADPRDDEVLPQIINIIPTLPDHPKLKYAGLLVLSRYTEWIAYHPEQIPAQLSYISAGLEQAGSDVTAAAAQAMNFLCQDCYRDLVPYLPQLYEFFKSVNDKLGADDLISISEGIAYVIAGMQSNEAPQALMQFSQPLLEALSQVAELQNASKDQLRKGADRMEQLEKMLAVIGGSQHLPEACAKTCEEAYSVIDRVLAAHGNTFFISERASALLRRGLSLFGRLAASSLVPLLERLSSCFEQTGFPGYVWIVGKCVDQFGREEDLAIRAALQGAFERVNSKMVHLLENTMPAEMGDVLDDYIHACMAVLNNTPSALFLSPQFPQVFRAALAALTLLKTETVATALDLVLGIAGHDSLMLPVTPSQPGTPLPTAAGTPNPDGSPSMEDLAAYAAAIRHVVGQQGFQLASVLLNGLVTQFSPEVMPVVVTTLKVLSGGFAGEMMSWLPGIVEQLPTSYVPDKDKMAFVERYLQAINGKSLDQVKHALNGLYSASRKARERNRIDKEGAAGGLLDR